MSDVFAGEGERARAREREREREYVCEREGGLQAGMFVREKSVNLCVNVCVYIRMCLCMHACMHVCTLIFRYIRTNVCMYIYR